MIKNCLRCSGYNIFTGECTNNEQYSEPKAIAYPANFQCDHFRYSKFMGLCNSCKFYKMQCCTRFGICNINPEEFGCAKYKERKKKLWDTYDDTDRCIGCKYFWEKTDSSNFCNYWKCSLPDSDMHCKHFEEV